MTTPPAIEPLELNGDCDSGCAREQSELSKNTAGANPPTTAGHIASAVPTAVLSQVSASRIRVFKVPSGRSSAFATCR